MSSCQLFRFSFTSLGAIWLRLLIFIFYFFGSSAGSITLALSIKSIGFALIILEVIQTLYCSAPWSYFEMWWGARLEKSLTLDITSALLEVDGLDIWLPQKQLGLGSLLAFLEKLHHLLLPTALKTKRHRDWNRIVTSQQ